MNIFRNFKRSVKQYLDYEKSISDLNYMLGYKADDIREIKNLITWYRKEYTKRPEQYPGDHVAINKIRIKCLAGGILQHAILKAKAELTIELHMIDRTRSFKR